MTIWIFYRTDGDSGWYRVKLFQSKTGAEKYLKLHNDGYSKIELIEVEP